MTSDGCRPLSCVGRGGHVTSESLVVMVSFAFHRPSSSVVDRRRRHRRVIHSRARAYGRDDVSIERVVVVYRHARWRSANARDFLRRVARASHIAERARVVR